MAMESFVDREAQNEIDDSREITGNGLTRRGWTSDDILRLLVYNPLENKQFVPNGALEELITFETITSTLATAGLSTREQVFLANVIVEKGRRIFAILVFINQVNDIKTLFNEGFTDEMLPVAYQDEDDTWQVKSYIPNSDNLNQEKIWVFFQHWKKSTIFSFCERQWMFLSPVFTRQQFKYILHRDAILPFVSVKGQTKQSYFSMVFRVDVHPAHQRFAPTIGRPLECAIKELAAPDSENTFEKEADALAYMREIDHKHLIKCIAAVQKERKHFFVFPWADGGNLREFWAADDFPSTNTETICWVISQMRGLADALTALHDYNIRHGDLKPENILRFSDNTTPGYGRLVIADFGLAKTHTAITRSRHFPTRTVTGTARYEAPEAFLQEKSRSRVYDVWSMGCILLEFLIWVLHGGNFLQTFNSSFESYAHPTQSGISRLDRVAQKGIELMLRDPRCGRNTALGAILDFTKRRLLVPIQGEGNTPLRASAKELYVHLNSIINQCSDDSTYVFNAEVWETLRQSSLSSHRLGASLLQPTNSKGLQLPVQTKQNRRVPSLPRLIAPITGSASILGESLTEEPAPIRVDRHATPKPRDDYPTPIIDPTTPIANRKETLNEFSLDVQKEFPVCHAETEANEKSAKSTLYEPSSSDSCWSATSSCNYGSTSSISEDATEGASQDSRVLANLVRNKKQDIANKTLAWFSRTLDSGLTLAAYQQGETSASGGNTPGNSKPAGESGRKGPSQKKRKGVEDDDKSGDPDGEDGDEDDDRKRTGKKKPKTGMDRTQKFACPFFKHKPEIYGKNRTCRGHSWDTVHRTKEHLYRVHMQPEGRCHRCLIVFENVSSLQVHQREPVPCDVVENSEDEIYIDAQTAQKLRRQPGKRSQPKKSEPVKWKEMFSLLFPNVEPIPSPYYDDNVEKRSELEVIQDFSSFAAEELRTEMEAVLAELDIEEALKTILVNRFQSSQPRIQEKYLLRQGRGCSSTAEQETESPAKNPTAPSPEESSHNSGPHSESGEENDTRNEGGGATTDTPMNCNSQTGHRRTSRQLDEESPIPQLLANFEFPPEINSAFPTGMNPSNYYTAPASLQSTESYHPYSLNGVNGTPQNMSDSLVNYFGTGPVNRNTYGSFGTSPHSNQPSPYWDSTPRQNLGSRPRDPLLTPVPSTPLGRRRASAATPSYVFEPHSSPLRAAAQSHGMHFNPTLGADETSNRPRTVYPNRMQQPGFSYIQPSHDQNVDQQFFDSGYLSNFTMGHQAVRDAEEEEWGSRMEDCETG
ncbi:hypothetical protein O1611_g564 [Lasiodiplodia mahajangana]|uniref:Uncharacterized protein n=1 Tax=Lasiodiplodia mahajangana TaxID=1108764 RepID=A0ACC2JZV6_9PEZI|nr:hypothetical protein O1611_g564 [Lasiodiplodia mahajangana]